MAMLNILKAIKQCLLRLMIKKYAKIWGKIDSEPVNNDSGKYIRTKIKSYNGNVNKNFQGKGIPKENTSCKCLSLVTLDSVIRSNKMYFSQ